MAGCGGGGRTGVTTGEGGAGRQASRTSVSRGGIAAAGTGKGRQIQPAKTNAAALTTSESIKQKLMRRVSDVTKRNLW